MESTERRTEATARLQSVDVGASSAAVRRSRSRRGSDERGQLRRRVAAVLLLAGLGGVSVWWLATEPAMHLDAAQTLPRPPPAIPPPAEAPAALAAAELNRAPAVEPKSPAVEPKSPAVERADDRPSEPPLPEPTTARPPEPSAPVPVMPELIRRPPASGFGLQVGAFPSEAEALAFIRAHEAEFNELSVHLLDVEIPGKGIWYRVRVGRFKDKRRAEVGKERLDAGLQDKAIVVSYR